VTGDRQYLLDRFHFPEPRLALGQWLRGRASACIDVSDGLAADAGKLAQSSRCRAVIDVEKLPISRALQSFAGSAAAIELALTGGDDYELCFAVSPEQASNLASQLSEAGLQASCIGRLEAGEGVAVAAGGQPMPFETSGYDHFARA
jgi:thiamine-monophosphate kinase